eukprot:TRINITY_DN16769_c0_g1_i1.p1 TRINITY_DN16769_c0_g1~~TRINITY_DN16769_c0_g1_i1.p1  ORF type:complete len:130 (-),score=13.61 TRINITY_DN16769_c0_g1_i1:232-621(-)
MATSPFSAKRAAHPINTRSEFTPPESTPSRTYQARREGSICDLLHSNQPAPEAPSAPSCQNDFHGRSSAVHTRARDLSRTMFSPIHNRDGTLKEKRPHLRTQQRVRYDPYYGKIFEKETTSMLWGNVFF